MPNPLLHDLSQASLNAILTARTSKAISVAMRGQSLDPKNQAAVSEACDFLTRVVQGSLLVEGATAGISGISPSPTGLREYVQAISALHAVHQLSKDQRVAQVFVGYRERLNRLAEGHTLAASELSPIKHFFTELSAYFYSDLTRPPSENRSEPFPNQ